MDKIFNILSPQCLLIIVFLSVIGDKSNIPLKQVRYQPGVVELVLRSAVLGCFVLPSSASTSTTTLAEVSLILGIIFPPPCTPNRRSILTLPRLYLNHLSSSKLHLGCS